MDEAESVRLEMQALRDDAERIYAESRKLRAAAKRLRQQARDLCHAGEERRAKHPIRPDLSRSVACPTGRR